MDRQVWYASLPKKRMAVGALFLNLEHQMLIVKPTYRDDWLVPGGIVEADESPMRACLREVKEELGIEATVTRLLCVDYGCPSATRTESLHFVFHCDRISETELSRIKVPANEISDYRFVSVDQAMVMLAPRLASRIRLALTALTEKRTIYSEGGNELV